MYGQPQMHSTLSRFFKQKAYLMNSRKAEAKSLRRNSGKRTFPKIEAQKMQNSSSICSIKKNPYKATY
jgi:hypothetical protein